MAEPNWSLGNVVFRLPAPAEHTREEMKLRANKQKTSLPQSLPQIPTRNRVPVYWCICCLRSSQDRLLFVHHNFSGTWTQGLSQRSIKTSCLTTYCALANRDSECSPLLAHKETKVQKVRTCPKGPSRHDRPVWQAPGRLWARTGLSRQLPAALHASQSGRPGQARSRDVDISFMSLCAQGAEAKNG